MTNTEDMEFKMHMQKYLEQFFLSMHHVRKVTEHLLTIFSLVLYFKICFTHSLKTVFSYPGVYFLNLRRIIIICILMLPVVDVVTMFLFYTLIVLTFSSVQVLCPSIRRLGMHKHHVNARDTCAKFAQQYTIVNSDKSASVVLKFTQPNKVEFVPVVQGGSEVEGDHAHHLFYRIDLV